MTKLIVPIAIVDDVDEGQIQTTTVADDFVALPGGLYKIAAMAEPLLWKIGDNVIDATKGSYLAPGGQELVRIPAPVDPETTRNLRFIRAPDAVGDGQINIVTANLYEVPGVAAVPYETPIT